MKFLVSCFFLFVLSACNNESSTENTVGDSSGTAKKAEDNSGSAAGSGGKSSSSASIGGCYMQVLKRDTVVADLQQKGDSITGKLTFNNFEKDGSTGNVNGKIRDGIAYLVYTFNSEGMTSVMDMYLQVKHDTLVRGIGTMQTRGDTSYFPNPAQVVYEGHALVKTDCSNIPSKYR